MKAALKKGGNTRKPYDIRITIFILFIHARKKKRGEKTRQGLYYSFKRTDAGTSRTVESFSIV